MERFRDDDLAATLTALRPTPRPEFAAELDERAAAGFPRRSGDSTAIESASGRLVGRIRSLRPRQVLLPAGATALATIAVATAFVAFNGSGDGRRLLLEDSGQSQPATGGGSQQGFIEPQPENMKGSFEAAGESANTEESSGIEHRDAPPTSGLTRSSSSAASAAPPLVGQPASTAAQRKVERSAEMTLGAQPGEVGEQARKVFDAVHANDGIVLRSSIRDGADGRAGARFELLIPSGKLSAALADFSEIGEVRSRHEATADITAPTVTASEQLQDSQARIDSLLAQLADAETESEREAVEAELRTERRHAAALRAHLANLDRRANFSRVQVRIETGASPSPSDDDSSWGIGDALNDSGRILGIAVAVTLVGLAVLAPIALIALIALIAWIAQRTWVRRGRERALG